MDRSPRALTSVREAIEEDAWRASRQKLASKQFKNTKSSSTFHHRSSLDDASLHRQASPKEGIGAKVGDFTSLRLTPQIPVLQSPYSETNHDVETLAGGSNERDTPHARPSTLLGGGLTRSSNNRMGDVASFRTDVLLGSSVAPPARRPTGFPVEEDVCVGMRQGGNISGTRGLVHEWRQPEGGGDNDDVVVMGDREGEIEEKEEDAEERDLRKQLEAFSSAFREEFEAKLLPMATEGVKAFSRRATHEGRRRLENQRSENARDAMRLEEEGSRLRQQIAGLQVANAALATRADIFAERLSLLRARTSKSSMVARCMSRWRANATRARAERSRNTAAEHHARVKLAARTFVAWKVETRRAVNFSRKKAADLKLHAVSKEIVERYERELSATRFALDEANGQIALEKARQREMEEGMRRTLARGMSAMNMEASQLLTDAREAGSELLGYRGTSPGTRISSRTEASAVLRPGSARRRISEECPRPMAPPRPAVPSSR